MFERIYVEFHPSEKDVFLIDAENDESPIIALHRKQVEQLIIDLQCLLSDVEPNEESSVEGVE